MKLVRTDSAKREDLAWANDISFKIRFITGLSIPIVMLILNKAFALPFPILPVLVLGIFEAFVNQPYFFIRKRIKSLGKLVYINTSIDIIVITILLYYTRGLNVPFFAMIYLLPIIFATTDISIKIGLWLTTLSSVSYIGLIGLRYFKIINYEFAGSIQANDSQQIISCIIAVPVLYLFCFFAHFPSARLRNKSNRLRHKTEQLSQILQISEQRLHQLNSISDLLKDVISNLDINIILNKVVQQIAQTLKAERISIMLRDKKGNLAIRASKGLSEQIVKNTSVKMGERISGWVALNKKPLLVADINTDPRFQSCGQEKYYTKRLIFMEDPF